MKVTIVKYLNPKGKVVEMRKDNFKGSYMPENIIEEYEVEIKDEDSVETSWLKELKRKYATGNYILIYKGRETFDPIKWNVCYDFNSYRYYNFKLIHNKHKDILEAYLKNPSVEIETGMIAPMTGETEHSKWELLKKDFIEDYNEEFWYRLKVKDLAWYEDKDMIGKVIYDGLNMEYGLVLNIRDNLIETSLDRKHSFSEINSYKLRPATESEVLSLVYKPQQKISKENNLAESNRLMYLFLKDRAECLIENEQEFRLVYDFLDKNCDESLNRFLEIDGKFEYSTYNDEFPIILSTSRKWGNIYEWDKLQERDKNKHLIKFDGETFWEVFE